MLQGVKLSKTQNPTTVENRKRMKVIPYASAIGSIKYAMLCTRSIVYPTLILAREYNSDLRSRSLDSGQNYPYWNKDMFLDYGSDKRLIVKGYVDASFDTNIHDSKSRSRYILKVGAIS